MQRISKPHLVDLLRIFDRNRWIRPRIRYASVRSKPELITDLRQHFRVREVDARLIFVPKRPLAGVPKIEYDLSRRRYVLDGVPCDVPKESRKKPVFSISHVPVTLDFREFYEGLIKKRSQPSTRTASDVSEESPELGTRSPVSELAGTLPS